MKIVIAYLYYDLLNLYGESGNLKMLKNHLENQEIDVIIKFLTIDDKLEFDKYDLVLMSAGTEKNQRLALHHLIKYKKDIINAIQNKKFFLITGNAIDLFGKYIITKNKKKIKCLGCFDYIIHESEIRIVNDALFLNKETNDYIIGFQNQSSILTNNKNSLFEVLIGSGDSKNTKDEGIHYNNFYGTYLIGPLLVRNPKFTEEFIRKLILSINPDFVFKDFDFSFESEAYEKYFNIHYNQFSKKNPH